MKNAKRRKVDAHAAGIGRVRLASGFFLLLIGIMLILQIPVVLLYYADVISYNSLDFLSTAMLSMSFSISAFAYLMAFKKLSFKDSARELGLGRKELTISIIAIGIVLFLAIFALEGIVTAIESYFHITISTNVAEIMAGAPIWFNVGYIARVAKNFGIRRLFFAMPRANITGKKAITYSKHAVDLLESASVYSSLDEAVKDCDIVVGTTGLWRKANAEYKNAMLLDSAVSLISKSCSRRHCNVALVIGRDDIGMKKEELDKCDIIAYIPASPEYPVLNVSHALAIMLYEFSKAGFSSAYEQEKPKAEKKELELLFSEFEKLIAGKNIRNKKVVERVFKKIVLQSNPSRKEVHALITALK
mgnify:CR=1 FL=1